MAPSRDPSFAGIDTTISSRTRILGPRRRIRAHQSRGSGNRISRNAATISRTAAGPLKSARDMPRQMPSYTSSNDNTVPSGSNAPYLVDMPGGNPRTLSHHSWSNEDLEVEYIYNQMMLDYVDTIASWTLPARRDNKRQMEALKAELVKDNSISVMLELSLKLRRKEMNSFQKAEEARDEKVNELVFAIAENRLPAYESRINDQLTIVSQSRREEAIRRTIDQQAVGLHVAAICEIAVFRRLIEVEILRNRHVGRMLDWITERTYPDGNIDRELYPGNPVVIVESLHISCRSHDRKRRMMGTLRSYFGKDGAVPEYKRTRILRDIDEYYRNCEKNSRILGTDSLSDRDFRVGKLKRVAMTFVNEETDFRTLISGAEHIVNSETTDEQEDYSKIDQRSTQLTAAELIRPRTSLFRSGMSAETEMSLVSRIYTKRQEVIPQGFEAFAGEKTYHEVLTEFFTSPDVFFFFFAGVTDSWSLMQFADQVNTFIQDPLPEDVLEAFVGFCHRSGELFYITSVTRQIKPSNRGWSFSLDRPVAGPSRKLSFANVKRPSGIDKVEEQLLASKEFSRGNSDVRDFQARLWDLKRPMLGMIKRSPLSLEDLYKFILYWSTVGRFFVFGNRGRRLEFRDQLWTMTIWSVRNGWPAGTDPEFKLKDSPDIKNPSPVIERVIRNVETDVEIVFNKDRVKDTMALGLRTLKEHDLYAAVYNGGRPEAFVNEGVTRHQFHLFLRDCNKRNRLFKVLQDGTVTIIPEGRIIAIPNNNRNSVF